jgi:hypothetical protein
MSLFRSYLRYSIQLSTLYLSLYLYVYLIEPYRYRTEDPWGIMGSGPIGPFADEFLC